MAYIDKSGNVCDGAKQKGIIEMILSFFACIWLFLSSLLGTSSPNTYRPSANDYRQVVRQNGGNGGASASPPNYRPGGGGDGIRRNIGRLAPVSGTAPPPMGGGCCGGGGCG